MRTPTTLLAMLALTGVAHAASLTGRLAVTWGDPDPRGAEAGAIALTLSTPGEAPLRLDVPEALLAAAGGLLAVDRRDVRVELDAERTGLTGAAPRVTALEVLPGRAPGSRAVTGTSTWVTLPCRFADVSDEQRDLAYFEGMYDDAQGRLDHYWREVSFDAVNIDGRSIDWVDLPEPRSFYVPTPGSGTSADLNGLFDDCVAAADSQVDFTNGGDPVDGINLMFNADLDCCAWGGSRYATLDGLTKSWRTTWNPPWAFQTEAVIAHEMGHGFGLPHTNNSDGDGSPYDNPWDVMSAATGRAISDATYGTLGKHVNAYHKDRLGWIPAERRVELAGDVVTALALDDLARADVSGTQIVRIDIDGSAYYTLEARDLTSYDAGLAGAAVIIHEVVPVRGEPAWVVDADEPPATYSDTEGVMWRVGERFEDPAIGLVVEVTEKTTDGFALSVARGTGVIFADDFENGDALDWSEQSP